MTFSAIVGMSLTSCAKTGCYAVSSSTGQTAVDNNCNGVADIDEGNGSVVPGTTVLTFWGNITSSTQAYAVDNYGWVMNEPGAGSGNMYGGKLDESWRTISAKGPNGNVVPVLISLSDFQTMQQVAVWDNLSGFFKNRQSGKRLYFSVLYTGMPLGCTDLGSVAPAGTFNDGYVHYKSGRMTIFYQVYGLTFQ